MAVCVGMCWCVCVCVSVHVCVCVVFVHEIENGSCRGHKLKDGFKINKQVAWQIGRSQDSQLCRCLQARGSRGKGPK